MLTWNVMEISNLKCSNHVKIAMIHHYLPKKTMSFQVLVVHHRPLTTAIWETEPVRSPALCEPALQHTFQDSQGFTVNSVSKLSNIKQKQTKRKKETLPGISMSVCVIPAH